MSDSSTDGYVNSLSTCCHEQLTAYSVNEASTNRSLFARAVFGRTGSMTAYFLLHSDREIVVSFTILSLSQRAIVYSQESN